jgi:hypothetical protein
MTKLLEQAIAEACKLSEDEQDELAAMLLAHLSPGPLPDLDPDTIAAIEEARGQARRGEFAADEEMESFFKRHGI